MAEDDIYKLSQEEHKLILEELTKSLFKDKTSQENPQVFVLGGQPGAGKSGLIRTCIDEFNNNDFVIINADEFRYLHPQAAEIFALHPKDFALYTDPDVRLWGKEVFDATRQNHYNLIYEGTMRTTQICNTIKEMRQEGYKINIRAMAVPEIMSRISIYARYQDQLDRGIVARFTSQEAHNAAYSGMLTTLQKIEDEKLYDTIQIVNRNGDILFNTGDKNITATIEKERDKPLSSLEKKELLEECDIILNKMKGRDEKEEYIQDLSNLKHQLQKSDNSYARQINKLRGLEHSSIYAPNKVHSLSKIDIDTLKYIQKKSKSR